MPRTTTLTVEERKENRKITSRKYYEANRDKYKKYDLLTCC